MQSLGINDIAIASIKNKPRSEERFNDLLLLPELKKLEKAPIIHPGHQPDCTRYTNQNQPENNSQILFKKESEEAVKELIELLNNKQSESFLSKAGEKRKNLALQQNSSNKNEFGKDRADCFMTTPLGHDYEEYGDFLKQRVCKEIEGKTDEELQKGITLTDRLDSDIKSTIRISRISAECFSKEELTPEETQIRLLAQTYNLKNFDSLFVSVQLNVKKGKKQQNFPASCYVIPICTRSSSEDDKKNTPSAPYIIHSNILSKDTQPLARQIPPPFASRRDNWVKLIIKTIRSIQFDKDYFKKIEITDIKKKMAVLRYLLSQATLYCRGSAAIAEWIEKALYRYCGYDFEYKYDSQAVSNKKPSADLDAFTSLRLEDFITTYCSNAHLTKKQTTMLSSPINLSF